jgi:serine/threonine protein kinase
MLLNEHIELGAVVAEGGYGTILRATDLRDGRPLAVKIATYKLEDPTTLQRFEREARVLEKLADHPAIVCYVDHGVSETGVHWIAMEWMDGESLAERLARAGRLERDEVVRIGRAVLDALRAAHLAGVVHRDLKPSNVFLQRNGGDSARVRLIDFGLAWDENETRTTRLTGRDVVPGTAAYAAPEVLAGQAAVPTLASDIYALGVVLIEALEGRRPFEDLSATDAMFRRLQPDAVLPFDEVRAGAPLTAALRTATAREPAARFADAAAMRAALDEATPATAEPARHDGALGRLKRWAGGILGRG